jgi:hypothetical protein
MKSHNGLYSCNQRKNEAVRTPIPNLYL